MAGVSGNARFVLLLLVAAAAFASFMAVSGVRDGISMVTDEAGAVSNYDELLGGGLYDTASALLNLEARFESFVRKHKKTYSGVEEKAHRLGVFKSNLLKAVEHQALDPGAVHGITQFSDLTEEEFETRYMGLKAPPARKNVGRPTAPTLPTDNLPDNFDWRDLGAVTDVKNQGSCGSCWAFSTTGGIEGAHFLASGKLVSLSEQQLVDCDNKCDPDETYVCDAGCDGGLMTTALDYIESVGGLETEQDYPYTGKDGKCSFEQKKLAVKVSNFTELPVDEDQMSAYLVKYGPLSVGINANYMQTYIAGVSCPYFCNKKNLNHGVLIVGYGDHGLAPIRFGYKPYWIVKNSWGTMWGEHGYYRICKGYNECGVDSMVASVASASTVEQ